MYWSNLPEAKRPRGGTSGLWSSLTTRGFADPGVSGNQHQFRPAAGYNAVEGAEQSVDLECSPVQFLGNQQPVRRVVFSGRKFVDATLRFPFSQATPKIALRRLPLSDSAPRQFWRATS